MLARNAGISMPSRTNIAAHVEVNQYVPQCIQSSQLATRRTCAIQTLPADPCNLSTKIIYKLVIFLIKGLFLFSHCRVIFPANNLFLFSH